MTNNKVMNIEIENLISAPNNPFRIQMDGEMERLIESVAESGVIAPIIARDVGSGNYEIVSGHRRKYACEYLGIKTIPTIIKELDRCEAVIFLVDSNLQRENILPSEKAFAYKMKLEALSAQGRRTDLTSCQVGTKLRSDKLMAQATDDSARQIQRYIRLTNLIPELLTMVDEKQIALTPAVELSYLTQDEQSILLQEMDFNDCTPSLSQACRLKKMSQAGDLSANVIAEVMGESKPNQREVIRLPLDKVRKFAPHADRKQLEEFVIKACEHYRKYLTRQKGQER